MKIFHYFILIICTVVIFLNTANSATYYVNAATGNDNRSPVQATNISTPWLTVQKAIDNASVVSGDNIVVAEGTYSGFNLTKRVTVIGAWKGGTPTVNTIFTSTVSLLATGGNSSSRMFLKNLRVASTSGDAIDVRQSYVTLENVFATATTAAGVNGMRINGAIVNDVLIESCNFNGSTYSGIYFPTFVNVNGFIMRNSTVNTNGYFGVAAFQGRTTPGEITNVEISHCAFVDNNPTNQVQGHTIYFEKLKNSVFENISVKMPSGNVRIAIDINLLSRTDYSNITIKNSRIFRDTPGSGIWIQARNDLFNPPAALDTVLLRGLTFTNCDTNIAFNRQVKTMTVDKCDLSTYGIYGLVNYTDQGGTINAANNKWKGGGIPDTTVISGGLLTVGNSIISFMPSTDGIFVGMGIQGAGIKPGTTVIGKSPNTISMSDTAIANGFIPQLGFAFNFATSTDLVRTSLNFIRVANPLPFSIINQSNVSFPDLPTALAGTSTGGTIWNVPNTTITGTTILNDDVVLISPGAGFLHAPSLTTFENLTVSNFFFMGSDFAVANNYIPGNTSIGLHNTLIINGDILPGGSIIGGSNSDMFFGGAAVTSTGVPSVTGGLRTLHVNRPGGIFIKDNLSLERLLFLQNGLVSLNSFNLNLRSRTTIFNPNPATSYVNTNGLGKLVKFLESNTPTAFNFTVGRGGYSPVLAFFSSWTLGSPSHLDVRAINTKHPQNGCATDYLNRYWDVTSFGISNFNANLKFTYLPSDVVGTEANIIGARWNGFLFDVFTPVDPLTHTFTTNNINSFGEFTGGALNCIGGSNTLVNLKILLQGTYLNAGVMRTSLNTVGQIPTTQPFNNSQFNYPGTESVQTIPAGVVDWVYVELRQTSNGAPVLGGRRAGFVKSDGSVVDLDGISPLKTPSVTPGNYFIVVGHRNHLPVMSATSQSLSNTSSLFNFTTSLSQYFGGDAASLSGGFFGMYAGDPNQSFIISASDYQVVTGNLTQANYNLGDVNMNGIVSATDYSFITFNLGKFSNVPNYP
ncbi:MAG: hypothetical protein SGI89_02565 [bacterium]|nr:hypothetical protein [bacterium]